MQDSNEMTITRNVDRYQCWHCGQMGTPIKGYDYRAAGLLVIKVKLCSNQKCHLLRLWHPQPNYESERQSELLNSWYEGRAFEKKVPKLMKIGYENACKPFANDCYLAAAAVCRAMNIRIALENGYESKKKPRKDGTKHTDFKEAIDHLITNVVSDRMAKKLLCEMRDLGDKANHNLIEIEEAQALKALLGLDVILKDIYVYKTRYRD